ncbi:hypothetical protein CHS0354_018922 [Potamilus streckersoni]|uniref:Uncharacterized protein n=1 Tax=Potamilus streckersoni TaxID=2493646 RepID=A0AAE0VFB7_9BIVA|nr:hypothetical protein CHS0354_018922 [Potamilus streckersoni]
MEQTGKIAKKSKTKRKVELNLTEDEIIEEEMDQDRQTDRHYSTYFKKLCTRLKKKPNQT